MPAATEQRVRDLRARLEQDPANEADAGAHRPRRPRDGPLRRPRAGLSRRSASSAVRRPALASALTMMSARVYEQDIGNVDTRDRALHEGPRDRRSATSPRPSRSSASSASPSATGALADPPAQGRHPRGPQRAEGALFQAAAIEEDVLERGSRDRRLQKVLAIDADDLRRIDALIKRYLGLSRWQDLLAVYERKADLVGDPDEKKRIYYQVGAVYERELGDVDAGDRDVPRRSSSSIRTTSRRSAGSTSSTRGAELARAPQHPPARERELATIRRSDQLPVPDRRALREAPRRHPRAIELYRDLLQQMPDHQPTLAPSKASSPARRIRSAPPLVLEPDLRRYAASGTKLISVLEVQVAPRTTRTRRSISSTASRASMRSAESHGQRSTRSARARFDIGNEDALRTSNGSRWS